MNINLSKSEIGEMISMLTDACDAVDDMLCENADEEEDVEMLNERLDLYSGILTKMRKAKKGRK